MFAEEFGNNNPFTYDDIFSGNFTGKSPAFGWAAGASHTHTHTHKHTHIHTHTHTHTSIFLNFFPVSETNKFHYFDQYFNLILRDADSEDEELLINNITAVSNFLPF